MAGVLTAAGALALGGVGMRHALDPDHVATVDGITFGLVERASALAPWVGTLFALGHGAVVTAIAVAAAAATRELPWLAAPPSWVAWAPIALLTLVGVSNLRALLTSGDDYRPAGVKQRLLPRWLRSGEHPLAVLLIGVVFALMLDSAAQAAAWGYAAGVAGGPSAAFATGLIFTAGMTVAATLYGRAMCTLLRSAGDAAQKLRRVVGWGTVLLAFGVAGFAALMQLAPGLAPAEETLGLLGAGAVALFGLAALSRFKALPREARA